MPFFVFFFIFKNTRNVGIVEGVGRVVFPRCQTPAVNQLRISGGVSHRSLTAGYWLTGKMVLLSRRHTELDWSLTGAARTHNTLPVQPHRTVLRCAALWSHLIKTIMDLYQMSMLLNLLVAMQYLTLIRKLTTMKTLFA